MASLKNTVSYSDSDQIQSLCGYAHGNIIAKRLKVNKTNMMLRLENVKRAKMKHCENTSSMSTIFEIEF